MAEKKATVTASLPPAGRPSRRKKGARGGGAADKPEMKRLNFEIDGELHKAFKKYAAEKGVSLASIMREEIDKLLEEPE